MKLRLFTGLALVLALGGCASYGYVDDGGGYYSGGSSTEYRHVSGFGGYGYGLGYGVYGYGSPYYSYRYTPGWSLGAGYGYPYSSRYPYASRYPYYPGGGYHRPPYNYYPRPPVHPPRPGGHDGHPDRPDRPDRPPPQVGTSPPLDRAPWRDLERLRGGDRPYVEGQPRPNQMRPQMQPRADGEAWQGPSQAQRRMDGPRPAYPRGDAGPRYGAPSGPRTSSRDGDSAPRQMQPRMERREEPRGVPRSSAASRDHSVGRQNETGATETP